MLIYAYFHKKHALEFFDLSSGNENNLNGFPSVHV
ncbi:hypothetical protein NM3144_2099 [Neisseria meningitidis NM3144]|nr:hypothetical protein NM3144_2099 [Neisseria meningitidis NM3144]